MDGINQHPGRIDWNIRPADVFDPSVLTLLASNAVVIVWVMVAGVLKAEHPEADKALCRCREIECLQGPDAHHYAKEHLKAVETDGGWRTTYICPYTDKRWLLDFTKITDVDQYKYARLRPMPLKENHRGHTCIQDG